jgi:AcrR family transcriptional regulator
MNQARDVKRRYQSPLRDAQAAATRVRVIDAATRLFLERGYGATSIDAVAAAAGVSRATIFATVGSKPALLKTAYDVALVGDDEPIPFPQRPESRAVRAEPDPRRYLERYSHLIVPLLARVAPMYEAVRGAASADPEVRPVWDKLQLERRIGASNIVGDVASKGGLGSDADPEALADAVWVLIEPSLYQQLVNGRGWSPDRYEAWLARALTHELLG